MGTTVGSTKYLEKWLGGIGKLDPAKIVVSIDDSRHEKVPSDFPCELIHYDTKKAWESYDARHKNYVSDYSIGLGIKSLIGYFLGTDCTHFLCIDSDVMLDESILAKIRNSNFDYLQIGVPAASREGFKFLFLHWKSTNFGLNKEIAKKLNNRLDYNIDNSRPIDLKLHDLIRSLGPKNRLKVKSRGVVHYLNSSGKVRRVSSSEAEIQGLYTMPLVLLYEIITPPIYQTRNN